MGIRIFYFLILLFFWVICSGVYGFKKLFILSISGILFSLFISAKLNSLPQRIYKMRNMISYFIYIFIEMIKSSLLISAKIITNKNFDDAEYVYLDSEINTSPELVIYCNSITFTPGTFTVSAEENDKIIVHAFSKKIANELKQGEIERMVIKNFGNYS